MNSSIYFLGLITWAAVLVQALATSPSHTQPWGTTTRGGGGAHVGQKQPKKGSLPSSSSALSVSAASGDTEKEVNGSKKIETTNIEINAEQFIRPMNGMSVNSPNKEAPVDGTATKTILTSGGFIDEIMPATYVAETNLPTDIGHFRIRAYRLPENAQKPHPLGAGAGLGSEPCVIYCTDKPPFGSKGGERGGAKAVPVRIHDQCFTSEVFGSQR